MSSTPVPPEISVVIPTLDEAAALPALLRDLEKQEAVSVEVIVVDGGSSDRTAEIALDHGATVVNSSRGRGRQMNAGRDVAGSDLLLFLHADSRMPDPRTLRDACDAFAAERQRRSNARLAGHFKMRFRDAPKEQRSRFRFLEEKSALNRRHTTSGDQGLLIETSFFDELGRFDEELSFLEDQKLGERIDARGEWITLPGTLETSARRFFAEGFGPRYLAMAAIMSAWNAGVDEFFDVAPELYRPQREATPLDYRDVVEAIAATMERLDASRRAAVWEKVGSYAVENAWQPFFAVDVALSDGDIGRECLQLYERLLEPVVIRELSGAMVGKWIRRGVTGLLPVYLDVRDQLGGLSSRRASR